jgi:hypothetical protein
MDIESNTNPRSKRNQNQTPAFTTMPSRKKTFSS